MEKGYRRRGARDKLSRSFAPIVQDPSRQSHVRELCHTHAAVPRLGRKFR